LKCRGTDRSAGRWLCKGVSLSWPGLSGHKIIFIFHLTLHHPLVLQVPQGSHTRHSHDPLRTTASPLVTIDQRRMTRVRNS
jgi:hypothetical protein